MDIVKGMHTKITGFYPTFVEIMHSGSGRSLEEWILIWFPIHDGAGSEVSEVLKLFQLLK
jgi:hypothetical protein